MTIIYLLLLLAAIWFANYAFGKIVPANVQRGALVTFYIVLALVVLMLVFKVLKWFFVIAIPVVILLSVLILTRRK